MTAKETTSEGLEQTQVEERRDRWEQVDRCVIELQAKAHVQERPFVSHVPVVGRLIAFIRHLWNSVAARWYVLLMFQQQNAFNQAVVQAVRELIQIHIQTEQYLEQIENRIISSDQDLTLLARKIAEREYRVRQWERQATEERAALARRLAELDEMLATLDNKGADG
jgi:uncharacterized protein YlxW (UPF0749 family)